MTTAPNNEAFLALGQETLDSLKLPENSETLAGILLGHVVDGAVMSSDLSNGQTVTPLNEEVSIIVTEGAGVGSLGIVLNTDQNSDVDVIIANIEACNGYIHAIDQVLLPPPEPACPGDTGTIVDVAVGAAPEFTTLVDLVTRAGLVEYLSDPNKESTVFGE